MYDSPGFFLFSNVSLRGKMRDVFVISIRMSFKSDLLTLVGRECDSGFNRRVIRLLKTMRKKERYTPLWRDHSEHLDWKVVLFC